MLSLVKNGLIKWRNLPLKYKLIINIALINAVFMGIFITGLFLRQRRFLVAQNISHSVNTAWTLSVSVKPRVLSRDYTGLSEIAQSYKNNINIRYVFIADELGLILAHSGNEHLGEYPGDARSRSIVTGSKEYEIVNNDSDNITVAYPVKKGSDIIGWVWVCYSNRAVQSGLDKILLNGLILILSAGFIGTLFAFLFSKTFTGRLYRLLKAVNDTAAGKRDSRADMSAGERNEFLNLLINTIPDPVYYKDREGRFLGCNSSFEALIGHRAGEIIGKTAFDFLPPELAGIFSEKEDEIFSGREAVEYESVMKDRNGEERYYVNKKVSYKNLKGHAAGLLCTMHDFTVRKLSEERIKSSLNEKEILLSEVRHRVKNNLQVISSIINLQAGKVKDEEARKTFMECISQIRSIAMVHENLYGPKDFASMDYNEYLNKLVRDLFASSSFPEKEITYTIDCRDMSLSLKKGIPCGLIVTELITNAFKHAFPGGKGEIAISFAKDGNGLCTLTVKDNGIGISDGFSIGNSTTLGLSLVSILVRQLKGEIGISGGTGTNITITFPE